MNAQVAEIRQRMASGYHHCKVVQGIEDVYNLLEEIDVALIEHTDCPFEHDCIAEIAKEFGCANPATS